MISLYWPGFKFVPLILSDNTLYNISDTRLDFPDPLTPVTAVIVWSGNLTSIPLRLFSLAPLISI